MKKFSLYITIALASLFFGSCSDDYTDWANPQSYAQEDAINLPGFKATATNAIDLNQPGAHSTKQSFPKAISLRMLA